MPCAICGWPERGFYFTCLQKPGKPRYAACSMTCLDRIGNLETSGKLNMAEITQMEQEAAFRARRPLYDALVRCGVAQVFEQLQPAQIDDIILSVVNGFRASMQLQSASGEIPFPVGQAPTAPNGRSRELDDEIPF